MTEPRRYAILIGNSEFPEAQTLDALRCPPEDIKGMHEVLLDAQFGWFTDVELSHNEDSATVRKRIQRVFKHASPQDQILLYYSGHGKLDSSGRLHLATKDTEEDYLETTSVELSLLRRLITNTRRERVALILDCCHSGAAVEDLKAKGQQAAVVAQELDTLHKGIHVLSASTANQSAYEKEGEQYSLFTKHLLDGIRQNRADADGDGFVSISDLYDYVVRQVSRDAAQTPRYKGVEIESGKYIIARAEKVYGEVQLRWLEDQLLAQGRLLQRKVRIRAQQIIDECETSSVAYLAHLRLLESLLNGKLAVGDFHDEWEKLEVMNAPPSNMPIDAGVIDYGQVMRDILGSVSKPQFNTKSKQRADFTEMLNGVPLEMIYVPGGEFMMGSPEGEGSDRERPKHKVTVPALYIGKYQITQAQWKAVMDGENPARFKGDNLPVEQVSWHVAKEFCKKIRKLTGKDYRLPSEAEWEYACRAGTTGDYAGDLDNLSWYGGNAKGTTHPVGEKDPNAFGLYDMQGNVWEWCEDQWHDNYQGAPADGSAWLQSSSEARMLRGGSWYGFGNSCRSACRYDFAPDLRTDDVGFRVVVSVRTP